MNNATPSRSGLKRSSWLIIICCWLLFIFIGYHATLPLIAELAFRQGHNRHKEKKYEIAISHLLRAKKYAPWEAHYQVLLGRAYEDLAKSYPPNTQTQKIEKALTQAEYIYHDIIRLDNKNPWYINRLVSIYEYKYKYIENMPTSEKEKYQKKTEELTRKAKNSDPQNPLFILNLAFFLHKDQQIDEAIPLYEKVLEIDPRMSEAAFNLADIYRNKNQLAKVIHYYELIKQTNPNKKNIDRALISSYIQTQQYTKALPLLNSILEKEPGNFEALKNISAIYSQLATDSYEPKTWHTAAKYYKQILDYYPEETYLYEYYIQALYNSYQFDRAQTLLNQQLELTPTSKALLKLKKKIKNHQKSNGTNLAR